MADMDFQKLAGRFIVFDGPDGCGKTTQMKLLEQKIIDAGLTVKRLREPGGTIIGEQIRDLLLSTRTEGMDIRTEMLLYMSSRAQLVQQEIKPALARGEVVLSDRYASSTLAYQGGGGGLPTEDILRVAEIAVDGCWPALTIIFDLDTDIAMERLNPLWNTRRKADAGQNALFDAGLVKDRIEQRARDYFERVRENYRWQLQQWPERYRSVDAGKTIPVVQKQVMKVMCEFFAG